MNASVLDPLNALVGRAIRAWRGARGLTLRELAAVLDVSYQQLQKYERGEDRVPAHRFPALCKEFGIRMEEFFSPISSTQTHNLILDDHALVKGYSKLPPEIRATIRKLVTQLAEEEE